MLNLIQGDFFNNNDMFIKNMYTETSKSISLIPMLKNVI